MPDIWPGVFYITKKHFELCIFHSSNMQNNYKTFDPLIFFSVTAIVFLLVIASLTNLPLVSAAMAQLRLWVVAEFGWLFVVSVTGFSVFSLYLALSKYGDIKLGTTETQPAFGSASWFAMLFSAGMGIGLVFYGVAEPILHFSQPPDATPLSKSAARDALALSVFHWGIHAWGIYALMGLALAYFHHRRGEPLAIRSTLQPLLGRHTHRSPGKCIDILAVLATLFGLATSLGLGASQINAGLNRLFHIEVSATTQFTIIACITFCATLSLVSGLNHGIRRLSELNMLLALSLFLFIFLLGPTGFLLSSIPDSFGAYLNVLLSRSFYTDALGSSSWLNSWTLFYWAWWISWAPFVGTFIARISAGRTIREFVLGVMFVPSCTGLLWFAVFGGSALHSELFSAGGIVEEVNANSATAIFALLEQYPFATASSFLTMALIAIFFITSSDSGSFVVDMLTSGGNPTPPLWQRVFWAVSEGLLAAVLLMLGGISALQAGAISTGLPFCLVLIAICFSLLRSLRTEEAQMTSAPDARPDIR